MRNKDEKLDQLLHQFMDESQVHEMKDNLSFADHLFSESPAPVIDPKALDSIRLRLHRKLKYRKYLVFGKQLAVAAALIAVASLTGLHFLYPESPTTNPETLFWDDMQYIADLDTGPIMNELADLTESIHLVNNEIFEPRDGLTENLAEFEEIEEIQSLIENTDFWKG